MDTSSDSLSPVELLAEEFLDRQQRGENPTIEEYCQKHPDLAEEIHDVFEGFLLIEDLKPGSGEVSQAATGDRQLDGKRLDRVGDYRIIREVGRGGMGIVYEAEQESLRRRVALKVLPKQHSADEKSLERFQREARAAARMHHTNIVPVFEVGNDDQWVFYAMQLIQGQGLDLVIDDLNRIRTEHSLLKSQKGGRSNANATAKEPPAHSIAASLIAGRFQQENLAGDSGVTEISRDLSRQPQADISDSEPLRAYAETTVEQSSSTATAVLPGQSEISSAENHRNQYFNSVAQIGLQTARALSYAHARGIIHRDIKPSNLLLDAAGIVWVTDFGLAKTGDEAMTHTGDILGTIRYMSPERFRGQCDNRADVYSLGLTLYEMLVLKPAFSSPDRLRLIEMVTKAEPPLPRSLDPKIPRDLETIVLKCIDKDARRRYQSADELAEDLQHFVNDEPIKARRISLVERFTRWSRRNKALAAAMAVAALLLLVINIAGPLMYWQQTRLVGELETTNLQLASKEESLATTLLATRHAKDTANAAAKTADLLKEHAIDQQEQTRRNLYFAHMNMAQAAHNSGDFARPQELLDNWQTTDEATDLRGFEWYYLNSQTSKSELVHTLRGHTREVRSVAWSRDGKWIASGGHFPDNALRIWDAKTGKLHRSIDLHGAGIWGIDWHPTDNNLIATASTDRTVRVIDLTAEQQVWLGRPHTNWVFDVKWSPEGSRVASCGKNGNAHIWDSETGEQLFSLDTSPSDAPVYYWSLAWHPAGEQLAISSVSDSNIRIWRFESGDVELLSGHSGTVRSLDWRQDGLLASCGDNGEVILWDVANREKKLQLGDHQATRYNSVEWNPADDALLLTGGDDKSIRIWNTESGEHVDTIVRHFGDVGGISWSPDGQRFVSASEDGTLKVWEYSDEKVDFSGAMQAADWNPDGSMLAVGSKDGAILLLDSSGKHQLGRLVDSETPSKETRAIQFSSDGRWLASGGVDGYLRIWDIKTKTLWKRSQESHGGKSFPTFEVSGIQAVAWHPEENLVVTLGWDDSIRVWDSTTTEVLERLPIDDVGLSACFSPDGRTMVTGIHNPVAEFRSSDAAGSLTLWDTQTWTIIGELDCDGMPVHSIQFTSDGTRLAACSNDVFDPGGLVEEDLGWIRIWEIDGEDCNQWSMTEIAWRAELFRKLAWTADGKRLMTASSDGRTRLWDASSPQTRAIGRELLSFRSRSGLSPPVALSSDGTKLAVVNGNSLDIHDALPSYRKAKSPLLLPGLENRLQLGTATSKDFLLKAEIYAAQGDWTRAGQAAEAYLALDTDASWVLSDTWIAGQFKGDLSTTHRLEQLVHAEDYSPPDIDEKGQPLWQPLQKEPGDLVDFRRLEHVAKSDEQSFVYAFQRIYSPVTQYAAMLFGNGDFHQLWINGELLSEDKSAGPFEREEFAIPVKLNPGWNSLLVKVANESGFGQSLAFRLSSDNKVLIAVYEKNGQFDQAVKLWDLEVKAHPEDKLLLLKRAAARWNSGEHTGADRDYRRFLTGREQDASALIERAKSYSAFNRVDDALADLDQALMSEPNSISVREVAASVCLKHDRAEAARTHYESLTELAPDQFSHQFALAIVTLESGNAQEFGSLRTRLLRRWQDTQDPDAAGFVAWAALATPIVGQELEVATKLNAMASVTRNPYSLPQKGLVLYRHSLQARLRKNDSNAVQYLTEARQALEKGINGLPKDSPVRTQYRYTLAMALHHLGDDRALDVLNECELEYQLLPESESSRGMVAIYVVRATRREALQTIQRPTRESIDRSED